MSYRSRKSREPLPEYLGAPSRCDLCPGKKERGSCTFVPAEYPEDWATGPAHGKRILFLGEGPGKKENQWGRPFVGDSGTELDETYIPALGLYRDQVGISNVTHCMQPGAKTPKQPVIDTCSLVYFKRELLAREPDIVVAMGASANSIFQGCVRDWHTTDVDLELDHGMPLRVRKWGREFVLWPTYHPAAAMRDADYALDIREDMAQLRRYLRGEWEPVRDQYPNPKYRELANMDDLAIEFHRSLRRGYGGGIALDTESLPDGTPYCLTFSVSPDEGFLIMKDCRHLISQLAQYTRENDLTAVCHYYLHDEKDLRLMGLQLPWNINRMADTMMDAYHLQLSSQSLKTLSWRLLGIRMKEFNDVVRPHAIDNVMLYLELASQTEWDKGLRKPRQVAIHKKAGRILKALLDERAGIRVAAKEADPWESWEKIDGDHRWLVERELGSLPQKSIAHVPMDELLTYACQDAVSTLRLRPKLRAMAIARRKEIAA
jgi:uracil-DNA glycosylase